VCACAADGGGGTSYMYRLPRPPRCYAAYCGTSQRRQLAESILEVSK
jgi:hypothetical protein